jgi:flagellar basal-body rod protein FlgG
MWTAFRVAASGVQAQEHALDVSANNLANVQTAGYKARRAQLKDLPPGASTFDLAGLAGGIQLVSERVGQGASFGPTLLDQSAGGLETTGRNLDVAINGDGFFQVELPNGSIGYTRDGSFRLDNNRRLVTGTGLPLAPPLHIPEGVGAITIRPDGSIVGEQGSEVVTFGKIELAQFRNPTALTSLGNNLFGRTDASGDALSIESSRGGLGTLLPGSLEGSNVDVGNELVKTMQAQRAYQMNLRALRTVDEMVQEANSLGR